VRVKLGAVGRFPLDGYIQHILKTSEIHLSLMRAHHVGRSTGGSGKAKGARLAKLLHDARLRPLVSAALQQAFYNGLLLLIKYQQRSFRRRSFTVNLGEGQDDFANELALGHWELEKRIENISVFIANATVPAGAALFDQAASCAAVTELLDRHPQAFGEGFHFAKVGHRFAQQPQPYAMQ
jgi:hypothetical protein